MFMTQNASVETVAARTHKIERNDFMSRAQAGVLNKISSKEGASGEGQGGLEENGYGSLSAMEDSERGGRRPGRKSRSERAGHGLQRGR